MAAPNSPQAFLDALPHAQALGMRLDEVSEARCVLSMPYDPRLVGDPATGVLHGGAVYALMDTAAGFAATLGLNVDWDGHPAPGRRSVDRQLVMSLGYRW